VLIWDWPCEIRHEQAQESPNLAIWSLFQEVGIGTHFPFSRARPERLGIFRIPAGFGARCRISGQVIAGLSGWSKPHTMIPPSIHDDWILSTDWLLKPSFDSRARAVDKRCRKLLREIGRSSLSVYWDELLGMKRKNRQHPHFEIDFPAPHAWVLARNSGDDIPPSSVNRALV